MRWGADGGEQFRLQIETTGLGKRRIGSADVPIAHAVRDASTPAAWTIPLPLLSFVTVAAGMMMHEDKEETHCHD